MNNREKNKAIEIVTKKLLNTNIPISDHKKMAVNLLYIYNWDLDKVSEYII